MLFICRRQSPDCPNKDHSQCPWRYRLFENMSLASQWTNTDWEWLISYIFNYTLLIIIMQLAFVQILELCVWDISVSTSGKLDIKRLLLRRKVINERLIYESSYWIKLTHSMYLSWKFWQISREVFYILARQK